MNEERRPLVTDDDEFFSFTTIDVGFKYSHYAETGRLLLVVVQREPEPDPIFPAGRFKPGIGRIVQVFSLLKINFKSLQRTGIYHLTASKLPPELKAAIRDFQDKEDARHMKRFGEIQTAELAAVQLASTERTIQ